MIEEILTSEEVEQVVDAIIELYPREKTDLKYETEFELLVAAALTAQTTDLAVNRVTPELFEHFPTPEQMMDAPVDEIHDICLWQYKNTEDCNAKVHSLATKKGLVSCPIIL